MGHIRNMIAVPFMVGCFVTAVQYTVYRAVAEKIIGEG